jgi:hypothetical protein
VNTYQVVAHKRIVFTESGLRQLAALAGVS